MQPASLILLQDEGGGIEDEEQLNLLILATLVFRVLGQENAHIQQRNPSHLYLTCPQLMLNPHLESPWIHLWKGQNNCAFITTMGFDVVTFCFILEGRGHFADIWNSTPIPRNDISHIGVPRAERRSLDAAGALSLVLHYLGSAIFKVQLQQIFAIVPSVLMHYLSFSLDILLITLHTIQEAQISLPETHKEFEELSDLITTCHSLLEGAFGSINGLSLPIQVLDDLKVENATYNGWKTDHTITNVLMFSLKGVIIDTVLNAPGSWHDAHTTRPISRQLWECVPDGFYIISDMAFPRGPGNIKGKIKAPMKGGE
ncbi:hypothetical protein GYMLUDRAFT_240466 [Collybiopsis luxurians FD-317 M1]|nr:hypothetical protein GYMLUDRAFT_240466 [Collybiopsis luxurians FD-317 M1]